MCCWPHMQAILFPAYMRVPGANGLQTGKDLWRKVNGENTVWNNEFKTENGTLVPDTSVPFSNYEAIPPGCCTLLWMQDIIIRGDIHICTMFLLEVVCIVSIN